MKLLTGHKQQLRRKGNETTKWSQATDEKEG